MNRLGLRRRLLVVVVAAVALSLAALVAGFNLLLDRNLCRDADNLVRARAAAQLAQLRTHHGRLVLGEAPDAAAPDAQVWVFAGGRTLETPRAGARAAAAARRLAAGPARLADVPSADIRLYAAPVVADGHRLGTVVASVSLAPYEQTRRTALLASLALGGAVLLLVALAVRWLLAASLRPVARMTRQASVWSERDLDQRFGLGTPYDELTELAATLDGLLDRLAASLRREQRFSAELSHELRTPLARVLAETELALRRERTPQEYKSALELVHRNAGQLARTVDALIAAARHEAGTVRGTADAFAVAAEAAGACAGLAADRQLEVKVERPRRSIRLGVDPELGERILQPIIENACRYGRGRVKVSIERARGVVLYAVEDDGPGVAEDERERIFEPGVRGRLAANDGADGAGLGLALARRLASSAAGEIEAVAADHGARFLVRLPAG
jgi:two-component system, OmpR family, sensor kinase